MFLMGYRTLPRIRFRKIGRADRQRFATSDRIHLVLNDVNEQLEFSTREAAGSEATRVCPHARSPLALNSLSKLSAMKTQGLEPNKEYSQSVRRVNVSLENSCKVLPYYV